MKNVKIYCGSEAQKSLLEGVNTIAKIVKITLGPHGKFVIIKKLLGNSKPTKDGVTVAREVSVDGPQNVAAQLVREAAIKTNSAVGDGTTTTVVLVQALVQEGMKNIVAGCKPIDIIRGIEKGVKAVLKSIHTQKREITEHGDVLNIAAIAANGDKEVGKIVANAIEKVGKTGVIVVEEGRGIETEVVEVSGTQIEKGYLSPYFATDPKKGVAVLDSPYVLITTQKITNVQEIVPVLEIVAKLGRSLFIIAEDITGKPLTVLLVNQMNVASPLKIGAIKAPGFGENRTQKLGDIATLVGCSIIDEPSGRTLESVKLDDLGTAEKIILTKDTTTILHGGGSAKAIQDRVSKIQAEIEETTSDYERETLQKRLAQLTGGLVNVKVGGKTEAEMQEKKDRIEDAVNAARSAVIGGGVPGGGVALVRASQALSEANVETDNMDQRVGLQILQKALEAPLKNIVENAGGESSVVLNKVKKQDGDFGYDAYNNQYCPSMYDAGILDACGVVQEAVNASASTACVLLNTDALIYQQPETPAESSDGMGMDRGMM